MIIEINKIVQFKSYIEIRPTDQGYILSIQDEIGSKSIHLTEDELKLISDLIIKELGK